MLNVFVNGLLKFLHAAEDSIADAVVCNVTKPAFDHIQPRTARGCEMQVESRMFLEPLRHVGVLVRGVVVDDQMQVQITALLFGYTQQRIEGSCER